MRMMDIQHITDYATYDIKVTEFIPEYIGKMQFYLSVLDDKVRLEGENPVGCVHLRSKLFE